MLRRARAQEGKPPHHTRFKKGQSGNRKGPPKGSKNVVIVLQEVLNQKFEVNEGGHKRRITKGEAMVQVAIIKALMGDPKAINTIITLRRIGGLLEPVKGDEELRGGVLVVPATLSIEEWEQRERADSKGGRLEGQEALRLGKAIPGAAVLPPRRPGEDPQMDIERIRARRRTGSCSIVNGKGRRRYTTPAALP